jgi:hypothetical protein
MRKSSKLILVAGAIAALAVPSAAMANESGQTVVWPNNPPTGLTDLGPSAFGLLRAGTTQAINKDSDTRWGDVKNAGEIYSARGGENAQLNADLKVYLASIQAP